MSNQIDYSKHSRTYEASFDGYCNETIDRAEAVKAIEANGWGELITWRVERNLPRCQPDYVHRSSALDVYENGVWRSANIFGW